MTNTPQGAQSDGELFELVPVSVKPEKEGWYWVQNDSAPGFPSTALFRDNKWWAKANSYKRVLGFLHQKIAHKEREFKSLRESTPQTIEKEFMSVAKTVLVPETFYEILSIVHRRLAVSAE